MLLAIAAGALMVVLSPAGAANAAAAPAAGLAHPAIVGGSPISVTLAPWQVKVEEIIPVAGKQPLVFVCGGSILSTTEVLTAAHCVFNESELLPAGDLQVTAGTSNFNEAEVEAQQVKVSAVRAHPDYVPTPNATEDIPDDVAVLTLEKPLELERGVQPITLAPTGSILAEGALADVAGFGQENPVTQELSGVLNSITMNLVPSQECGGEADALFVCARTANGSVCFGDSGSALTIPGSPAMPGGPATPVTLVGVTDTVEEKCANDALAGFANVAAPEIRDFIEGSSSPPKAPRGGGSTIVGTPEVGQTLTCDPGTWTGTPAFTYLFINGANDQILQMGSSTTYLVSGLDVGSTVLCEVRAANAGGTGIVRTGPMKPIKATQPPPVTSSPPVTVTPASPPFGSPPAPGGTATAPTAASNVALVGTIVAVETSGKASVKVACRGSAACHGKLTLTAKSSVEVKGKQTVRTIPIGTASFSIPGGGSRTVQIKLGPVGRGLLVTGHGRLSARLAIVKVEPAPRQSQVKAVQLVLEKSHGGR